MTTWTERMVLDALHGRLCQRERGIPTRRYAVAEHARLEPLSPRRILDMVAVDTWRSTGFALHGFEVKVSRSDLLREIRNPAKSATWATHLDTFSIVAPKAVLDGWRYLNLPYQWGVLAITENGSRYLRKPTGVPGYAGMDRAVDRPVFAALSRAIAATARDHCVRHD